MPTDIIMPQMGESIVEGTITKWLKKPGDKVQRDEPLFEISTDKVDAEIPAPASGVLQEIKVTEGTTVGVNTVVGTIAVMAKPQPRQRSQRPPRPGSSRRPRAVAAQVRRSRAPARIASPATARSAAAQTEDEEARSSPLVRKIAREHGVSLSQVSGTGLGGRITKQDIMAFIESQGSRLPRPSRATDAPTCRRAQPAEPPHRHPLRRGAQLPPAPIPAISSP